MQNEDEKTDWIQEIPACLCAACFDSQFLIQGRHVKDGDASNFGLYSDSALTLCL